MARRDEEVGEINLLRRIVMEAKKQRDSLIRNHISYALIEEYVRKKEKMNKKKIETIEKHLKSCQFCQNVYDDCEMLNPIRAEEDRGEDEYWEEIWETLSKTLDCPCAEVDHAITKFEDKLKETSDQYAFLFRVQVRASVLDFWRKRAVMQDQTLQKAKKPSKAQDPIHVLRSGLDQALTTFVEKSTSTLNSNIKN